MTVVPQSPARAEETVRTAVLGSPRIRSDGEPPACWVASTETSEAVCGDAAHLGVVCKQVVPLTSRHATTRLGGFAPRDGRASGSVTRAEG